MGVTRRSSKLQPVWECLSKRMVFMNILWDPLGTLQGHFSCIVTVHSGLKSVWQATHREFFTAGLCMCHVPLGPCLRPLFLGMLLTETLGWRKWIVGCIPGELEPGSSWPLLPHIQHDKKLQRQDSRARNSTLPWWTNYTPQTMSKEEPPFSCFCQISGEK